jgi:hypothetical protein
MSFKAQNSSEYESGLHRRGGLTSWIEDAELDWWQRVGLQGQTRYWDIAIEKSLMDSLLTLMTLTITPWSADGWLD